MTKYFLHGGYEDRDNEENTRFFKNLVGKLAQNATVLLVLFARPESDWSEKSEKLIRMFSKVSGDKNMQFVIANAETDEFLKQLKKADLVYLRGGNTQMLREALEQVGDLRRLFEGKIIAGSSAGAYLLSKYYYTRSLGEFVEGFGLVPVKVMCHFVPEMEAKVEEFKDFEEDLPVVMLKDYAFEVFEV